MDRGEATRVLDAFGIDAFVDATVDGKTITAIAKNLGVARSSLLAWIASDKNRAQRAIDARRLSAAAFEEQAEEVLLAATDQASIARARELASHYRWRASKADPTNFADKIGIGAAPGLPAIERPWSERTPEELIDLARRIAFLMAQGEDAMRSHPAALPQPR